jgi:acyl-coenzyme A synthetase/AMP-(fatty) acid ligase
LIDDNNLIADPGSKGEICVRGTSLALGYYGNADKTSLAFVQNPLNGFYPDIIYRTGDLGCYNELGELMYLGRKDHQIKYLGHRIELSEIEAAVNNLEFVKAGCCFYDERKEKIVLFYQSDKKCDGEIAAALLELLPKYMVPKRMIHYNALPLNKNSKINRTLLIEEYRSSQENS